MTTVDSSPRVAPATPLPGRVAIVGGGLTGLAAAHHLLELAPHASVHLFEAAPRLGGVLETETIDGYQIERGSDSFITNRPAAVGLCKRLGLSDELVTTNDALRRTFVVAGGKLEPVPEGFLLMAPNEWWPVVSTSILSWSGKLRLACEYLIPAKQGGEEESLAAFARRRLGRETFERLVQPLVGGIYTADAECLSLKATLPRFLEMEREHGSLIRAAFLQKASQAEHARGSGARYSLFVTPRRGLGSLIESIAARLPAGTVRLRSPIESLESLAEGGWRLRYRDLAAQQVSSERYDAVILATPAPIASRLLASADAELSRELALIPYAGAVTVSIGYDRKQIAHPLNGFGFVVPEVEGRKILACSFSSVKFPGRAPAGKELLRVFIGGAKRPDLVEADDADLEWIVRRELRELIGVRGRPEVVRIARYRCKMPQYHLGHQARVAGIESRAAQHAGLELAGNAYHGVGIPDCIQSGERAAERVLARVARTT